MKTVKSKEQRDPDAPLAVRLLSTDGKTEHARGTLTERFVHIDLVERNRHIYANEGVRFIEAKRTLTYREVDQPVVIFQF